MKALTAFPESGQKLSKMPARAGRRGSSDRDGMTQSLMMMMVHWWIPGAERVARGVRDGIRARPARDVPVESDINHGRAGELKGRLRAAVRLGGHGSPPCHCSESEAAQWDSV